MYSIHMANYAIAWSIATMHARVQWTALDYWCPWTRNTISNWLNSLRFALPVVAICGMPYLFIFIICWLVVLVTFFLFLFLSLSLSFFLYAIRAFIHSFVDPPVIHYSFIHIGLLFYWVIHSIVSYSSSFHQSVPLQFAVSYHFYLIFICISLHSIFPFIFSSRVIYSVQFIFACPCRSM